MASNLVIGVLGPVQVSIDSVDRAPKGTLQRRLLAMLVLHANAIVSADALCEALWPTKLPADHHAALHTHMFRLRRSLPAVDIERTASGYRLSVDAAALDARVFETAVTRAATDRDGTAALTILDGAEVLWRGRPYEELGDVADAAIEAERLIEIRNRASEVKFDLLLAAGRHRDVLADLDAFAARHPLRERPQGHLMTALHREGRNADALAVYDRYRRRLGEELGIDPSPQIARLHDSMLTASTADLAEEVAPQENQGRLVGFGRHDNTFVGREDLVANLDRLLTDHRIVTVLGTGGVGKTRLASEVCRRIAPRFPDGVWFCALAQANSDTVALTVAVVLDIEPRSGADPVQRIAEVLQHQKTLLVLDNCEHVLDEAAALAETVVHRAPGVTVLVTSRERLRIDGEHLCPVPPLPLPSMYAADQPAVQLFTDRADAVLPRWEPSEAERAVIATVCRRLDGLPLAIELAAARLHTLTLDEIADGLDDRLRMLTRGRRTVGRHSSLGAAIEWSYSLLDDDERRLFEAVSVFHGPFPAAGAAAVVECSVADATDILSSLVERSLLQRSGTRYLMLESLRDFGAVRLQSRGATDAVLHNHARFMIRFVAESNRRLRMPDVVGVLDDMDVALADMRNAFAHLLGRDLFDELLDASLDLHDYGLYRMRPEVFGWAQSAAERADAACSTDPRVAEAFAIGAVGAWKRGDLELMDTLVTRSKELSSRSAISSMGYYTAALLTLQALVHGRLDDAIDKPFAPNGSAVGDDDAFRRAEREGVVLLARGYRGDEAAPELATEMLRSTNERTPILRAAWINYVAGESVLDTDPATAAVRLARAMDLARRCGSSFVLGIAGSTAASLETRHGDAESAVELYRWLLPHWRRAGVRSLQWTTLRSVAELLARLGLTRAAAVLLGAVTSSAGGHDIYGEDDRRLRELADELRRILGTDMYTAALAEGGRLDDNAAAARALSAFDHRQV
ncbi:winged helix-turn-helix domain-containing protein [Antrihabitans sp. YC3-6]|uniref:Winged helix-turn-helix domain-containing protein n=1 Tax=Antrihabitans stalagmiti TaxID=2799499 RepID=A0A934NM85_9NOCA|nr:BTAD domain-containing putative transcriptional regulator [Antrihabitans stalagmiti]MBJ8337813.1 winged helix-turn-helix domain-containing protein [Antrihabitans stalagmiti]